MKPLVDHADPGIRQVAAWWLARRGASREVRVEMLTRLSQPDSTAARNAADVLGEFHYVSSIPALAAALSNPIFSGEARAAMARALGNINRPAVIAPLTAALSDGDAQVKTGALLALRNVSGVRDGSAVVPLVADADAGVRAEAAITLGTLRRPAGCGGARQPHFATTLPPRYGGGRPGRSARSTPTPPPRARRSRRRPPAIPSPLVRSLAGIALTKLSR